MLELVELLVLYYVGYFDFGENSELEMLTLMFLEVVNKMEG